MKYINKFSLISDYQTFKEGEDYVIPNVCLINENNTVSFNPIPPPLAGDVAYWDGSKVKTTPLSEWSTSLGTPVGVVVVPKGFAPDRKVRIVSLYGVDDSGNTTTSSSVGMAWGGYNIDTSLTNYNCVPYTDNPGRVWSNTYGYLPSDMFTGTTSYVDSKAKYYNTSTSYMIPSPYLGEDPNPDYYKILSSNNALTDFNGLSNTQTLVDLGSGYTAANAAWKYKDDSSNLQWYLPGMGELGYIMPRFNKINATITALGGLSLTDSYMFWSSSEYSSLYTYCMMISYGRLYHNHWKDNSYYVRPFAIIE